MAPGILRRLTPALLADSPALSDASACSPTLERVYAAHFRYVWRSLKAFGVHPAHLDDAVHDVFLVVQRKLHGFDGEQAQVTTWLYEIAIRVGRRYRKRSAREGARQVDLAAADHERGPAPTAATGADGGRELERRERLELARAALATLDDAKREVFVLACIEQRSAPEIARITGVTLNTVYSRIRAARQAFQAEIDRRQAADRRAP
jgi:RNA polymerase sigma-70 factor, ECF subfamily